MRFAGIDYGLERTGLAVSDPSEQLVFPLKTVYFKDFGNRSAMLDGVAKALSDAGCEACVLGIPLVPGREESLTCRQIRNVLLRLQRRLPVPFYLVDECLSSEAALARLKEAGVSGRKRKGRLGA